MRELAFCQYFEDIGGRVQVASHGAGFPQDFWQFDGSAARTLAEEFVRLQSAAGGIVPCRGSLRPDGLFHAGAGGIALGDGDGNGVHLISCNNEMPYLDRLRPAPATLDIRAESIGRRGVEQLIWRLEHLGVEERIRKMVEPALVVR